MKSVTGADIEKMPDSFVFIYSRFCGTCHVTSFFLYKIEQVHNELMFNEVTASFATSFLSDYQMVDVSCLITMQQGEVKERVYTFSSIGNIYHYLYEYYPVLFAEAFSTGF